MTTGCITKFLAIFDFAFMVCAEACLRARQAEKVFFRWLFLTCVCLLLKEDFQLDVSLCVNLDRYTLLYDVIFDFIPSCFPL